MRSLFYVVTAVAVMALAFWAYRENYTTQAQISGVERLQSDIGSLQDRLNVLKAEWAYQNRPERLRELVQINFDRLKLLPLQPQQFAAPAQITYPPKPDPAELAKQEKDRVTGTVSASGQLDDGAGKSRPADDSTEDREETTP